jgi:prepilin-type N-terminal cleavage/methylation domain-containing protein
MGAFTRPKFIQSMKSPELKIAPKSRGMTLLELTVVILVLLSLISILFIGARAWKKGSDRSACIMQIRNVQQAVRSHCNMNAVNPGATVTGLQTLVIGTGKFIEKTPSCPASGTYSYGGNTVPSIGTLYMTCSLSSSDSHVPVSYTDW